MLNYKTCNNLKACGFPQDLFKGDWYYFVGRKGIWLADSDVRVKTMNKDQYVKCPNIGQLMEHIDFFGKEYIDKVESDLVNLFLNVEPEHDSQQERLPIICKLWHKKLETYVPVTNIDMVNRCVTWDGDQWDRTFPPCPMYELDEFSEFDMSKKIKYENEPVANVENG